MPFVAHDAVENILYLTFLVLALISGCTVGFELRRLRQWAHTADRISRHIFVSGGACHVHRSTINLTGPESVRKRFQMHV